MSQNQNIETTSLIRTMVRSGYDLQGTRMQTGARLTLQFKIKLGLTTNGMSEAQLDAEATKILTSIRKSYTRITDGIVLEGQSYIDGKLPTPNKFKGDEIITTYAELIMVDQYMTILSAEEQHFNKLEKLLKGIPIYDEFLINVEGCGKQMSAVLISEIDITKAEYPSSLHAYAGLDTITYGKYSDESGKEHIVPAYLISQFYDEHEEHEQYVVHGRYPVTLVTEGRSRKAQSLVKKTYINKKKEESIRDSITFNPFLKTKLVGVLGSAFLRASKILIDGSVMGMAKRLELAELIGFEKPKGNAEGVKEAVLEFLKFRGYDVKIENTKYGEIYYNYKRRLQNMPQHDSKSDGYRHNMAIRYAVKMFLNDYYAAARRLAGLPVSLTYAEAKLGIFHGVAGGGKPVMQ